jgi:hypothetical protein
LGRYPRGGINRHLINLKKETLDWLEWQTVEHGDAIERENYLVRRANEGFNKPQCPEPYQLLLKLQRFKLSFYSGGFHNQPHILMREFEMCMSAEDEFRAMQRANQKLKELLNPNK